MEGSSEEEEEEGQIENEVEKYMNEKGLTWWEESLLRSQNEGGTFGGCKCNYYTVQFIEIQL